MYLYHYYEKTSRPFLNLSDLSIEETNQVLENIRKTKTSVQCAKRQSDYMNTRLYYENILREEILKIIDKYGLPQD